MASRPARIRSDKLLAAHFADAIDLPTLKRHQTASAQASQTSTTGSPSMTSTTPAGARSCTTRCGCSPTRTTPTPDPTTPTGE